MNLAVPDNAGSIQAIPLPDGVITLHRNVFEAEHDRLFQTFYTEIPWQQQVITLYGRTVASPRLSAWYGDPGAVYRYSGLQLDPLPWTPVLLEIKQVVTELAATPFNSVLLNLYRDGQDSMGWHSDAEPELGRDPVIASVSLGAVRRFVLRHKKRKEQSIALELEPGSVLVMGGPLQHHWRHALPKTRQPVGPRINLTFRLIQRLEQTPA